MKRTIVALMTAVFAAWVTPAGAAPPTVTPSPGYDARLQEQRAAASAVQTPVAPVTPRRGKKIRAH